MGNDKERREDDRRKTQLPVAHEDRRKGEKRSGTDRRATTRTSAQAGP